MHFLLIMNTTSKAVIFFNDCTFSAPEKDASLYNH